ncbi:MAG: 50S ribosomal protein L25 [Deltaproteobacteria bacterium]|nr:50S ribosomal protein L25 [Deltaproteobacteria bacterium]
MDFAKVPVEIRHQSGKGPARRARRSGKLPCVLYGHKVEPVSLALDPVQLIHALDKERKRNTVFTLQLKDATKSEDVTAMIRDVQIDPLSRQPVHVDFVRVSMDEEVKVTIPLIPTGMPVGVVNGGNLHLSYHALPIAAKPDAIPTKLEIDVTHLDVGDVIHAGDLRLPPGVRAMLDAKAAVASVVAPHVEKVEAEAAAAAPVEGAAPAEGAAAPAAPGAGAAAAAAGAQATAGGAPAAGAKAAPAAPAKKEEKKGK